MPNYCHVEILQKETSNVSKPKILELVEPFLKYYLSPKHFIAGKIYNTNFIQQSNFSLLLPHISTITICDENDVSKQNIEDMILKIHIYRLDSTGPQMETIEDCNGTQKDELAAASHWILPSSDFEGMWDSLIYDNCIKEDLIRFAESTLLFSDLAVDSNLISWNRVILLHGPPGTGKTSLCKALANKLSIRMNNRYTHGQLVEINSHSLFSKWFSESGKLVMKMFGKIQELIEDPQALVCVLIDEVESLTHARTSAMSGTEPSDSIRVVNAVLTQIDQIRRFPNVLILTTSNINGAIDLAFVDRADIKQYIGLPSTPAIYEIYRSCIDELFRTGIITPTVKLFHHRLLNINQFENGGVATPSYQLYNIADFSKGLSGRSLRKVPFLAHSLFLNNDRATLEDFLEAMKKSACKLIADIEYFLPVKKLHI